ncbi:BTAD domain-containing putative transcriptional regulator [Streptosporangium sp. NPDC003464]
MEFRVLGAVGVRDGGVPVELGGPRQRAVLSRLLLARGAVVSTDTLIDDLYGGAPPVSALATLQSYVSNLRRVIEPGRAPRTPARLLLARPPGYLLAATDVDAIRFGELVARSESRSPDEALACLDEAMELWHGPPYGEFADEPWAVMEVRRLQELRLVAIERRAQALLACDRPQAVITFLEDETAAHPLRERLWCLLTLALYRTGRQADALAALRYARELLAEELGLDPGPELRALEDDILRQADSLLLSPRVPAPAVAPAACPAPSPACPAPPPRGDALPGRERQLAELEALAGRGTVGMAAVSGEPGIGKTRLLETFGERCAERGHLVLWGRCHDAEGAPPLWPWLQVLQALAESVPPPDRGALAGLLDDETPAGSTEAALLRRHQAVARWLVQAARIRPLVVVLDDLHWADPASLGLLGDVATLTAGPARGVRLTVVVAFRDSEERPPLQEVLGRLARHDLLRVGLAGLGGGPVRELAAGMGIEVDESTAGRLAERTGGNPFFVRESVRLLAQGQDLEAVPDAVADLIRRRLAALGWWTGGVLGVAAVIGRDFDPGVVAEVCQAVFDPRSARDGSGPGALPEACRAKVYDTLDRAARAGLTVPRGNRMAFVHDLVRETLVGGIPPLRKAMVHREAMAVLATRPGTDVAVIAHHAVEAGPAAHTAAARWAVAAAQQASLRLAYEEAAVWWGRAVAAHGASAGDPIDHVELLLRQVRALLEAGDALGARQARAEAVRAADRAGAGPELTARALTALDAPTIWTLRNPYEAVELRLVHRFEAALRELPATDSPERARLLGGLAQELYDGTDDPRCRSLSAEAVEMARRLGDPQLLMRMLNARHLSLPQPLHIPELLEIADELEDLALRTRVPGFTLLAQMLYTHFRLELADLAGADRAAARCEAMLERLPLPWPRFQHTMWRAHRLALAGRFDEAETLFGEAGRQAERVGVWHAGGLVAMGRLALNYQRDTMAGTGPLIDAISGIHPSLDHDARVLQLCAQGRVEEAGRLAEEGWRPPPRDWSWLSTSCLQAAAQAAVGDVSACQVSYSALLPYSGRVAALSAVICVGPVDWFLALLASAVGDHTAASWHLAAVARLASQAGLMAWRDRAMTAGPGSGTGPQRDRPASDTTGCPST